MNILGLGNLMNERREDTFLFLILLLFFLTPGGFGGKCGCGEIADGCGREEGFADSYGEYSILILLIILQFLR